MCSTAFDQIVKQIHWILWWSCST